jgi:Ca2+-binding EF-hand superfamily protein
MKLFDDQIDELMEKLDHKNSERITWQEFLKFLDHEGMKREVVNDAQLYGIGVKRLKEK